MAGEVSQQGVPEFADLEIVKEGLTTISSGGAATNWTTIPHNLGYRPIIISFLNNVTLGSIADNADIPLPTYTGLFVDTAEGAVDHESWLHAVVDAENVHFVLFNATGGAIGSLPIKYYLLRSRSS